MLYREVRGDKAYPYEPIDYLSILLSYISGMIRAHADGDDLVTIFKCHMGILVSNTVIVSFKQKKSHGIEQTIDGTS